MLAYLYHSARYQNKKFKTKFNVEEKKFSSYKRHSIRLRAIFEHIGVCGSRKHKITKPKITLCIYELYENDPLI